MVETGRRTDWINQEPSIPGPVGANSGAGRHLPVDEEREEQKCQQGNDPDHQPGTKGVVEVRGDRMAGVQAGMNNAAGHDDYL